MGVANWLSPKVSKPETVKVVELKGKARAKPRLELRACVRCSSLAPKVNVPTQVGLKE